MDGIIASVAIQTSGDSEEQEEAFSPEVWSYKPARNELGSLNPTCWGGEAMPMEILEHWPCYCLRTIVMKVCAPLQSPPIPLPSSSEPHGINMLPGG